MVTLAMFWHTFRDAKKAAAHETTGKILSRSLYRAMLGLVLGLLPMTWWLRAILFVPLCFVCVDFVWRSPFTYRWPKTARTVIGAVILGWLAWIACHNVTHAYQEETFPPTARCLTFYGTLDPNLKVVVHSDPPIIQGEQANRLTVDGRMLSRFSERYKLVGACFRWNGTTDCKDVTDISKSGTFDIGDGPVEMAIPWNSRYLSEIVRGDRETTYVLLLVPKNLSPSEFNSVRSALAKGARVLQSVGGPP